MSHVQAETAAHALTSAAELLALKTKATLEHWLAGLEQLNGGEWPGEIQAQCTDGVIERRLAGPEGRPWRRLVELFSLSPAEADLLELALAVFIEPALGPMIARAQRSEGRFLPTEPLIKRLKGHAARPIWRPTSALSTWRLLRPVYQVPGEPPGFEADPRLADWLFGTLTLDAGLVLAVSSTRAGVTPPEWPVKKTAERLAQVLDKGAEARLILEGRAGSGRTAFGAAVARAMGRAALVVDPVMIPAAEWVESFVRIQRFALYSDTAVIWREGAPTWPSKIPMAPVQIVCAQEGVAGPERDGAADLHLTLPEPALESKAAVWCALMPQLAEAGMQLAATPGLLIGDFEETSRIAPQSVEEAAAHLRSRARMRMQGAGRVVDPRFSWDDLVAPAALISQLRRIAFEARARTRLLENPETARLYESAASLSALFCGAPGVGKSMAAQVIARDLGVNLLVVDLATTTSKFIGETAKNLSAAFARARAAGAALIFEEADAFFAKRTEIRDSNDRHANADTNHLLQLMEMHDGLVILSTNRRANIDPAFIRRLRHIVEFPMPGPEERRRLWELTLAALAVETKPLAEILDRLVMSHELSPAQIKGAALNACYAAMEAGRKVSAPDLEAAAGQELTKEGRSAPVAVPPHRPRSPRHG